MNKTKKGFLSAASIITIVASGLAILMSIILFLAGSMCSEKTIVESYKASDEYVYHEEADGSYYFVEIDEDTLKEIRISEDEIELIAKVSSALLYVGAVLVLGFAVAKLILAIKILMNNNRNKFGMGTTISLLVLSVLSASIVESAFLIVTLCLKDKKANIDNNEETQIAN